MGVRIPRALLRLVAVSAVATALALAAGGVAQAAPSYKATIRDGRVAARELLAKTGAASLSLSLVDGGRTVWQEGFGQADKATHAAPGEHTMYGLGSVSKMIATVAIMQLADEGLIDLDAPVVRYVPQFHMATPDYRQITVRMCLNHTGGFPGSEYRNLVATSRQEGYLEQMLDALSTQRLKHAPGQMAVYSNDGFTMIELLVFSVTGKPYAQYVQERIFDPMDMEHSTFPDRAFADGSYAKCYTGEQANAQEYLAAFAAGAMYSTPADMAHFASMLMNGGVYGGRRIVSAAAIAQMAQDQTAGTFRVVPKDNERFGLGWDTIQEPGLRAARAAGWNKGGDSADYHATFTVAAPAGLACVVQAVAPAGSGQLQALAQRILLHALVDKGLIARMPSTLPTDQAPPPVTNATEEQLKAVTGYFGQYNTLVHCIISKSRSRGLTVKYVAPSGETTIITGARIRTDGHFWMDGKMTWISAQSSGGRTYLYSNGIAGYGHYRENTVVGQFLPIRTPISATWTARAGDDWLLVNEMPSSVPAFGAGRPVMNFADVTGLPGYLWANVPDWGPEILDATGSDDLAAMFMQSPGVFGSRDQEDLRAFRHDGQEWMTFGSQVFRPGSGLPTLAPGPGYSVVIGPEGYAEWRAITATSAITITGAKAWHVYDAGMQSVSRGETGTAVAHAPGPGSRIIVFGDPGDEIGLTLVAEAGTARPGTPRGAVTPKRALPDAVNTLKR